MPYPPALPPPAPGQVTTPALEEQLGRAEGYRRAAKADTTRATYERAWRGFLAWCDEHSVEPLPAAPAAVAAYLAHGAGRGVRPPTLAVALAAIALMHAEEGLEPPTRSQAVRDVMLGIRKTHRHRPAKKLALHGPVPATPAAGGAAAPAGDGGSPCPSPLEALLGAIPDSLVGRRDRALVLVGYAGAFRRSEVAGLMFGDLEKVPDGILVHLARSKGDRNAAGTTVHLPLGSTRLCPVTALRAWMEELLVRGITGGPVFRAVDRWGTVGDAPLHPGSVPPLLKRYAAAAGLDRGALAGHSLKRGILTAAAMAGLDTWDLLLIGRHASVQMSKEYVERSGRVRNPVKGLV